MLSVFNVRRYEETITVWVDPEGMRLETLKHYPSKEVKFSSWKMAEFPEAFVASAEKSLEGFKGYSTDFNAMTDAGFIYGGFRARAETTEWIDFHITIAGKSVSMQLRPSEVRKIVYKVKCYWNKGNEIVHRGQTFHLDTPYVTQDELNQRGLDDLPLRN